MKHSTLRIKVVKILQLTMQKMHICIYLLECHCMTLQWHSFSLLMLSKAWPLIMQTMQFYNCVLFKFYLRDIKIEIQYWINSWFSDKLYVMFRIKINSKWIKYSFSLFSWDRESCLFPFINLQTIKEICGNNENTDNNHKKVTSISRTKM